MKIVTNDEITFVVAGTLRSARPFQRYSATQVVASIKKHFPRAFVIVSTTDQSGGVAADSRVLFLRNPDPGPLPSYSLLDKPGTRLNNINRQIVNVSHALAYVQTPYTVKTRTDFVFFSNVLLRRYNDVLRLLPPPCTPWSVLRERMLVTDLFTTAPRSGHLFHVSDCLMVGLTADLKQVWKAPLMTIDDATYGERVHPKEKIQIRSRLAVEQHLMEHLLLSKGYADRFPTYYYQTSKALKGAYKQFAYSNLCIVRYESIGISSRFDFLPRYLRERLWNPELFLIGVFLCAPCSNAGALRLAFVSGSIPIRRKLALLRMSIKKSLCLRFLRRQLRRYRNAKGRQG